MVELNLENCGKCENSWKIKYEKSLPPSGAAKWIKIGNDLGMIAMENRVLNSKID